MAKIKMTYVMQPITSITYTLEYSRADGSTSSIMVNYHIHQLLLLAQTMFTLLPLQYKYIRTVPAQHKLSLSVCFIKLCKFYICDKVQCACTNAKCKSTRKNNCKQS